MNLNVLEYLGVLMILFLICLVAIFIYYMIKDALVNWKKNCQNKCPFCGARLHGYQYKHKGAKFDAKYCSRCGRSLNRREKTFDPVSFRRECKTLLWSSNEYRERVKNECDHQRETTPDEIQN